MNRTTICVGLDVHKDSTAVAVSEPGAGGVAQGSGETGRARGSGDCVRGGALWLRSGASIARCGIPLRGDCAGEGGAPFGRPGKAGPA